MASTTNADVLALSLRTRTQGMQFLSLAPTTSASYPATPLIKPTSTASTDSSMIEGNVKTRRSSSSASSAAGGASGNGRRFLKLGPVHFGEGYGCEGDWSEEVLEA